MENQTMEQAQAALVSAFRSATRVTYENAISLADPERLTAFAEELTAEEKDKYYVTLINLLSNRLDETEAKANFAATVITLAALTAVGYIGTKNIKVSLDTKKKRRLDTDILIEGYLRNITTKEELIMYIDKKDRKYTNKMTNEKIFE